MAGLDPRVDRAALEKLLDHAFARPDPDDLDRTHGVVIVQRGAIVSERYAEGVGPDDAFRSWSMAKSITNALVGVLVRQGRLDVHIPLFPPGDAAGRATLFAAMARKLKLPIKSEELPPLPDNDQLGGNEMEGLLVRALRVYESGKDAEERGVGEAKPLRACIESAIKDFRPSAHVERLELMDLLAVKECTDTRFLPERFRKLSLSEVNARIERLKAAVGE